MKYLFFDIECADGGRSTICSFGYVIADMSFNVLEQRDILINPEGEFAIDDRTGERVIELAYPEEEFLKAPTFDKVYDEIKAILEAKDCYVVGHSVENDIKFLNMSCKRYGMPPLEFEYFDTQRTYKDLRARKQSISLQNALIELGIDSQVVYHRSDEDARATMLVLRALLEKSGKSFVKYAEASYDCTGRTFDFYWGWNGQTMDRYNDVYYVKYTRDFIREIKPGEENTALRSNENYVNLQRYIDRGAPIGKPCDALRGEVVCISANYEAYHYRQMLYLVGLIKAAGGRYTKDPLAASIFVEWFYDKNGAPLSVCKRSERIAAASAKASREIKTLGFDGLLSMLGITRDELSAVPDIREDYFLTVREI